MRAYLIRRFLLIIPTFLGISLITFLVVQLAPGNPLLLKLRRASESGGTGMASVPAEYIEQMKKLYGLDKPLPVRYVIWLKKLVTFDFGTSYKDQRPVIAKIAETIPITLQLNLLAIFLVYLLSVPIGVYSATHPRSWSDNLITIALFILYSLPSFWVAMLLMFFFGGGQFFNWFPVYGISSIEAQTWPWGRWLLDRIWHLVLPVTCLTYAGFAGLSRFTRAGLIENIRQDYVRTARAYGFSERVVVFKYAMRNSLIPIITLLGTLLPALIGGSVIIESIFSIPGMGRLSFEAILSRDYPLIMGILSIDAILTLVGLIISDMLYATVDPRIRFE
ncbi:MAG: ABC transporter permease [Candidatus Hydrogenedentes bacterium]|nr:ABC transporter permease [Candidatus Hydrogenedentota bacterium]